MNRPPVRFPAFPQTLIRLLAAAGLGLLLLPARAQSWTAAARGGGAGDDDVQALVTDAAGTQYLTGWFEQTITFGATTLTSAGQHDIFLAARSAGGQWLWAVRAGGSGDDSSNDLQLGPGGDLWLASAFGDVADYGPDTLVGRGNFDVAVSRLSAAGQWRWTAVAGGPGVEFATSVVLDPAGNATVAGDFGFGDSRTDSAITIGATVLHPAGSFDIFVARLSPAGQWQGAVRAGGPGFDRCYQAVAGPGGSVTLTGQFGRTENGGSAPISFGPHLLTPQGESDAYVARLSALNQWEWAVPVIGPNTEVCLGLAADAADNVYVAGASNGPVTFGSSTLPFSGALDGFVAKLNAGQQWEWAQPLGGSGSDIAFGVALAAGGEVLVTGAYAGTAAFGPAALTAPGSTDAFVGVLAPAGQWLGAVGAGCNTDATGYRFGHDATGHALVLGVFTGAATFGGHPLSSGGDNDFFVATLDRTLLGRLAGAAAAPRAALVPNPATTAVRLTLPAAAVGAAGPVELLDSRGRCVGAWRVAPGETDLTIPLAGRPAGLYLVRYAGASQRLVVE